MLHEIREKMGLRDDRKQYMGVAPAADEVKPESVRGPEPKP
jgi:hypothetical protein